MSDKQRSSPHHALRSTHHVPRTPQPGLLDLVGIAVAVAWLILVGASYAALFLFPAPPDSMSSAPAPPDLSRVYLPLLAAILILGIIRQLPGVIRREPDMCSQEDLNA